MKLFLFMGLLVQASFTWAGLSPALQSELVSQDHADVIIYLYRGEDVSRASSIIDRDSRVQYVVQKLLSDANGSQRPILERLKKAGLSAKSFISVNAIAVKQAPERLIRKLSRLGVVRSIGLDVVTSLDFPFPGFPEPPNSKPSAIGTASHLKLIKVDQVWDKLGVRGKGIVIAGQDTGYFWKHDALKTKYRGFSETQISHDYNWHDGITSSPCSSGGAEPCDDKDHGTHTMGSMVGEDSHGNRVGVAPDAKWIGCRNMRNGEGTVSSYLECFDFFLAPFPIGQSVATGGRPELAPHIVNNSWSCPKSEGCTGEEFLDVIHAYRAAGILLVAAAGNNGPNCGTISSQPARFAGDVLVVGAWNTYQNEIAFFSGLGPSNYQNLLAPHVTAVGSEVKSSMASGVSDYEGKSGTSMAAPQVAGVVALLWSHRPELIGQIDQTLELIQRTADPILAKTSCGPFPGSQSPNAVYGYGMVNAYRALTEQ